MPASMHAIFCPSLTQTLSSTLLIRSTISCMLCCDVKEQSLEPLQLIPFAAVIGETSWMRRRTGDKKSADNISDWRLLLISRAVSCRML